MNQASAKALILVVEDNDDVRDIVTIYLRRNGYAVTEAADGEAALSALENMTPNLILLDVLLPKLDGMEVLKQLRASKQGESIPVVMMSAVLQTRDLKAETARLNVKSFLQKPFQMRTLMEHVEGALKTRRRTEHSSSAITPLPQTASWKAEQRLQMTRGRLDSPGKLEQIPVPEILHKIFIDSKTGRLQICSGTTEKRVFFQNGLPVYAESSIPEETLGAHLVRKGKISREQHSSAVSEMTASGRHFGEILLKLDLLGPHDLFVELESHLTEKVISTFAWHDGTYNFEPGDSWKDDVIVARMKPGRILLDGVQKFWKPSDVQSRLRITDMSRTFPLDASPYSEEQLGLSTQETRVIQMVKRGLTVGDIVRNIRDLNLVISTLYALFVMEHLGFILSSKKEASRAAAPTEDSQGATRDEYARALLAEYLKFRTADYFKLLGVPRGATDEEITNAFKKRQQRYHPDTLVGIDTGLVHEKIEELYVRIHDAYRTLIDPEAKAKYLEQIEGEMPGAPMAARSKSSRKSFVANKEVDVMLFEEGFSLLRGGQYRRAHDLFTQALEQKHHPRYEAHQAWSAYLISPSEKVNTARILKELHKKHPDEALYPYLMGNLALREKDKERAEGFFERAVKIDPQHIDSARQLRILRMRSHSTEASGLFDLFKKK